MADAEAPNVDDATEIQEGNYEGQWSDDERERRAVKR